LLNEVIQNTVYGKLPIGAYGYADLFPKLTEIKHPRDGATRMGDFTYVYLHNIPIVLRAQIARHRPIMFTDTMAYYLTPGAVTSPVASKIALAMVMPTAMAVSMLTKRNCWIAQEDLWAPVIRALNREFGDDGAFMLPCDKGYCPVSRDNLLRHEGKDPAPACPIWYGLEGVNPDGAQRAAIMGYMDKRTLTRGMWQSAYMEHIPDPGA
jgi:hypothetical protein